MGTFRRQVQFYRDEKQITNFTSHWQKYFEALTFVQILDPSMKKPSSVNRLNAGSVLVILKLSNKICKDGLGKHECQKMQSCFNPNRQFKFLSQLVIEDTQISEVLDVVFFMSEDLTERP